MRHNHRRFKTIIILGFCALYLLSSGTFQPVLGQGKAPTLEKEKCKFDIPDGLKVQCGYMSVPENRTKQNSRKIRLYVAIIKSHASKPAPDPVVYLEGGPGGSAVMGIDSWTDTPILDTRDFILLDQRGTGYSEPNLTCGQTSTAKHKKKQNSEEDFVQACYDDFVAQGIDLSAYNSIESAADVADLRIALGYKEWNLLGISYGTRLALSVMRDHPEGLRSVIIDSVYPPNVLAYEGEEAYAVTDFKRLFDSCAKNAKCNKAFPKLEQVFYNTIEKLNANPADFQAEDPATGDQFDATLTGDDLVDGLFEALYSTELIPSLPKAIWDISNENYEAFNDFGILPASAYHSHHFQSEVDLSDADGMFNSVECAEEIPFNNESKALESLKNAPPAIKDKLISDAKSNFDTCKIWKVKKSPDLVKKAVVSDIPTLVLAGEFDPVTPPAWGKLAAKTLSASTFFLFPGAGHGETDINACSSDIMHAFLSDPSSAPDGSCIDNLGEPDFVTS